MPPRPRALLVLGLLALLLVGLLAAGPAHVGAHGPDEAGACHACLLHAAAPPPLLPDLALEPAERIAPPRPPVHRPAPGFHLLPPPRAPPPAA